MAAQHRDDAGAQSRPDGQDGMALLAEEIRLLVEMVVEHALPWLDELLADGHGTPHFGEPAAGGEAPGGEAAGEPPSAACQWCPLCAVIAVARGQRPEFAVRLFEQAAQVVALLRAVLADRWDPGEGVHMPGFRPHPAGAAAPDPAAAPDTSGRSPSASRVQHITVRRRGESGPGAG